MSTSATQTKRKKFSVGNIILTAVLVVLLVLVILLFVGKSQNKPTFIFGKACIWIMTPSMTPTIPEQTYILIEKIDASDVNVDDVIVFVSDDPEILGSMNTHRVIEIIGNNEEFVTKGDNNAIKDSVTAKSDKVVGRYIRNLPIMTAVMRFFLTKGGLITVLILFVLMTAAFIVPDFIKAKKEAKVKAEQEQKAYQQKLIDMEIAKLKAQEAARAKAIESISEAEPSETEQQAETDNPPQE